MIIGGDTNYDFSPNQEESFWEVFDFKIVRHSLPKGAHRKGKELIDVLFVWGDVECQEAEAYTNIEEKYLDHHPISAEFSIRDDTNEVTDDNIKSKSATGDHKKTTTPKTLDSASKPCKSESIDIV